MKKAWSVAGVLMGATLVAGCCMVAKETREKGTKGMVLELFNGKDLGGWVSVLEDKAVPREKMWWVENGLLMNGGLTNGYLRTPGTFKDFRLTWEFKFVDLGPYGNTGILVHISGEDKVWPTCIECQGRHEHIGEYWIFGDAKIKEPFDQMNGVLVKGPTGEKPVGEWNTFVVECRGEKITTWCNGVEVSSIHSANVTSGHVALQAEKAVVATRRIAIERLE